MEKTSDKLTIVTNQMAALAHELKELDLATPRRDEIARQIMSLGKLYLAIQSDRDLSDEDR